MLIAYELVNEDPVPMTVDLAAGIPPEAIWIDLMGASREEIAAAERLLSADIPEPEEAREIEYSSRFYVDNKALVMTPSVLTGVHRNQPVLSPVTFILSNKRIATVRYEESKAFGQFMNRAVKPDYPCSDALSVLFGIWEAIIDRTADVIEKASGAIDSINGRIFDRQTRGRRGALEDLMTELGYQADLTAKARESLSSMERMIQFMGAAKPEVNAADKKNGRVKLMTRDISSLSDQLDFLANKLTFLLEATVGLISIQQNEVIRVLTVAAMIFFPPTLVGTIYGMNFDFMPELHWTIGYPLALGAMALSGLLPYLFFKKRGWL
jgi:magnesium transporter